MKFLRIAFFLLAAAAALHARASDDRLALVIGNSAYPQAPLANPKNDAQAMAQLLRNAGFEVNEKLDTSQEQLSKAIDDFGRRIRDPKVKFGLFYYAGHGLQLDWRNYLVPVTADIRSADDVRHRTVDVSELFRYMNDAKGRSFLIILDACRDNPFGSSYKPQYKGLSQFDAPTGSLLAYATAPGNVALDGEGSNGLYTSNLLTEFKVQGTKVEDVFKRVRLNVRLQSHGRQVPWETTSLEEDVYLFPTERRKLSEAEQEAMLDQEIAAWSRVKSSNSIDALAAFLRQHPSGYASELAQSRLNRLLAAQAAYLAKQEEDKRTAEQAAKAAEEKRVAEERQRTEEARRLAEAQAARLAAEREQVRLAEAARREREEEAQRVAEAKRRAQQEEAQRVAAERARREAEAIAQRQLEEARRAEEAQRVAAERARRETEAVAQRQAEEARRAQEQARLAREQELLRQAEAARIERERETQRIALAEQRAREDEAARRAEAQRRAKADEEARVARETARREAEALAQRALEQAKRAEEVARIAVEQPKPVAPPPVVLAAAAPMPMALPPTPYSTGYAEHVRHYKIGDVYRFRIVDRFTRAEKPLTLKVTAVDIDGDRVEYNGGEYLSDLMGNILNNTRGTMSTPRQFYPAEIFVGKKWQTMFKQQRPNGVSYTFKYDVKVVGREKITVPAGTFDAFRIEAHGFNMQLQAPITRTIWIVPGIPADIAHETTVRLRNNEYEQYDRQELVSIESR